MTGRSSSPCAMLRYHAADFPKCCRRKASDFAFRSAPVNCRPPSSCRSPRRHEKRIGAVVRSAAMLSLLSEAHRIVPGSQESDPLLCCGAALVAPATLVADPLHQSPPADGVFRACPIRAYQRRHAIGIIKVGNKVAHVDQFALPPPQRPAPRIRSVSTRQKFTQTWRH